MQFDSDNNNIEGGNMRGYIVFYFSARTVLLYVSHVGFNLPYI
jgi:hypothetical protein